MPQVTVFIRNEDLDKWKGVEKKSEFMHKALNKQIPELRTVNPHETKAIKIAALVPPHNIKENPDGTVSIADSTKPAQISAGRLQQGLCKIHNVPLDKHGRCLQKGCKYA